ncbi:MULTISPECIES: MarR family winged helix-turn-helix transcriptional regulator [Kordiimonas]|mgnify:CR=1 FL=1|uniref:MarR family winged helix-turn-helix transcriptional regulator n=1 Tax=Kordiimonas TaxID=288021 RepID=UPI00257D2729|nr:winged helix DNA-binding protein [Kordiimonas sp. UBA4487]
MSKDTHTSHSDLAVFLPDTQSAFIGLQLEGLVEQITNDSSAYLQQHGFKTPALAVSSLLQLWKRGPVSLADLARAYDRPHQLIAIRLKMLEANGLAYRATDTEDKRRKLIHLTDLGQEEAGRLWSFSLSLADAVNDLYQEIGVNLTTVAKEAANALHAKPLTARMQAPL